MARAYPSTHYQPDEKKRIAVAVRKLVEEGKTVPLALSIVCDPDFPVYPSTYRKWNREIASTGSVGSLDKHSGRPAKLKPGEWHIFVGWAVVGWLERQGVTVSEGVAFILKKFKKTVVEQTVRNYFHDMGFSAYEDSHRRVKYAGSSDELINMGERFVRQPTLMVFSTRRRKLGV